MMEIYDNCIFNLSPRPLHRRGSPCAIHLSSVLPPSPVERGRGRGQLRPLQFVYFSFLNIMKRFSLSIRTFLFAMILLANVSLVSAQNNDWGLWTSIDAKKKLPKKWDLGVTAQYRWKDNISVTDQIRGSAEISRKLGQYVQLGAGYELIANKKVKKDIFVYRNRFWLQSKVSYKYARFTADWRFRMQLTMLEKEDSGDASINNDRRQKVLLNRFGLKYDIKKTPLEPYINVELFHQPFSDLEYSYYQNRFSIGTEYKINKHHSLEAGYKLEAEVIGSKKNKLNVVKIGYSYSF